MYTCYVCIHIIGLYLITCVSRSVNGSYILCGVCPHFTPYLRWGSLTLHWIYTAYLPAELWNTGVHYSMWYPFQWFWVLILFFRHGLVLFYSKTISPPMKILLTYWRKNIFRYYLKLSGEYKKYVSLTYGMQK